MNIPYYVFIAYSLCFFISYNHLSFIKRFFIKQIEMLINIIMKALFNKKKRYYKKDSIKTQNKM